MLDRPPGATEGKPVSKDLLYLRTALVNSRLETQARNRYDTYDRTASPGDIIRTCKGPRYNDRPIGTPPEVRASDPPDPLPHPLSPPRTVSPREPHPLPAGVEPRCHGRRLSGPARVGEDIHLPRAPPRANARDEPRSAGAGFNHNARGPPRLSPGPFAPRGATDRECR